eukprot:TRINITY_DN10249_c0_g1_i1.p1 TRINITY_DN10249_c0_g1~~TRINITY_DN10249_c0_g1_i1.p1  ORF type:complete len:1616 (+),score=345.27 TRINITY_DN10249_c0_g1_i1:76-4923(+)
MKFEDVVSQTRKRGPLAYGEALEELAEKGDPKLVVAVGMELLKDKQTGKWLNGLTESAVCGKLFGGVGSSEVGYSCLQCAVDNTCVICVDCFDEELHRGHEWRMIQVSGMCDCGDVEGWAPEGCCKKHRGFSDDVDPTDSLSPEVKQIAEAVCGTFCKIAATCCLEVEAARQEEESEETNNDFQWKYNRVDGGARALAKNVLATLVALANVGSPTCRVISKSICKGVAIPEECESSILHNMMTIIHSGHYRRGLALEILKLAMSLIADPELKYHLAVYISKYPTVRMLKWMNEEEGLAVQFLTVPRIAKLLEKPNASIGSPGIFHALTSCVNDILTDKKSLAIRRIPNYRGVQFCIDGNSLLSTSMRLNCTTKQLETCTTVFMSVGYCLIDPLRATYFLKEKTLFDRFLMHLLMLQNSFACYRKDTDNDAEGEGPAQHELRLLRFMQTLQLGAEHLESLEEVTRINENVLRFIHAFVSNVLLHRDVEPNISWLHVNDPYRNSEHGVHYQISLYRFLSALCSLQFLRFPKASISDIAGKYLSDVATFAEQVITLVVTRAQCYAGMWRKNHMGIESLSDYYQSPCLETFLKQPEYFLLQMYAAHAPSQFVAHLAHRYRAHQPLVPCDADNADREHNVVGHLLRTIMIVATERVRFYSRNDIVRKRVITELATGPKKYSQICQQFDLGEEANDAEKDEILGDVADSSERMGKITFRLKKEMWPKVSPYTLSWEESLLLKADTEFMSSGVSERTLIPVGSWVEPPEAFKLLVGLLHNQFSLSIAICVIRSSKHKAIVDGDLRAALDLILLSLRTRSQYKAASKEMLRSENRFYSSRCEEGVRTIAPSGIIWNEGEANDVAEILMKKTTFGDTPFELIVGLFTEEKAKELRNAIKDIADELKASGVEGAAEMSEKLTEGHCPAKKEKKQAKARKAKGKAKQQAAMEAMRSQSQSLDFLDISDADSDCEEEADETTNENRMKSLHHTLDQGWMSQGGDKCCLCQSDTSPGDCNELGLIAMATRGSGMQRCFESSCTNISSITHPPDGRTNAFNHPLLTKTGHEIVHSCGHLLHTDCLTSHLQMLSASYTDIASLLSNEYRGFAVLDILNGEFLCPYCGRIANTLIPNIVPGKDATPLPTVISEVMSDSQKKRCDEEIEELLCDIVTSPEKYLACGSDVKVSDAACDFHNIVAKYQFSNDDEDLLSLTGTAVVAFAQQVVFTEISHRQVEGVHIPISLKKLVALRCQLKALLAAELTNEADSDPLRVLLHIPRSDECPTSSYPLLTVDVFGVWIQTLLNVVLRVEEVNHGGYVYLMKRVLEAQLCKLILELQTAGIATHAPEGSSLQALIEALRPTASVVKRQKTSEDFQSGAHIRTEMGVLMSWLLISHCVVTAPLFSSELTIPDYSSDNIISDLSSKLPLGEGYDSIEGIAEKVLKRSIKKVASLSVWTSQQLAEGRNAKIKLPIKSDLMYSLGAELPREFSSLINRNYGRKCKCGNTLNSPALCLSCNSLVNEKSKHSCCSMRSHALTCGAGQSVYMLLGESRLVAIDGKRIADIPPLYVDVHGEDDPHLDRGKPLFLSKHRVERISRVAALSLYGFDTAIVNTSRLRAPPFIDIFGRH